MTNGFVQRSHSVPPERITHCKSKTKATETVALKVVAEEGIEPPTHGL